jgi:hypothetical protein
MQDNNQTTHAAVLYRRTATQDDCNFALPFAEPEATRQGLTIVARLHDDRVSGQWTVPPPELERGIRMIEAREARYLMVDAGCQISRSWPMVSSVIQRVWAADGVFVMGYDFYDRNDPQNRLMLSILDHLDHEITLDLQRKTARRNERRRELGAARRMAAATA